MLSCTSQWRQCLPDETICLGFLLLSVCPLRAEPFPAERRGGIDVNVRTAGHSQTYRHIIHTVDTHTAVREVTAAPSAPQYSFSQLAWILYALAWKRLDLTKQNNCLPSSRTVEQMLCKGYASNLQWRLDSSFIVSLYGFLFCSSSQRFRYSSR